MGAGTACETQDVMAPKRKDNVEERAARIQLIVEELRLNAEELREVSQAAADRARKARRRAGLLTSEALRLRRTRR